MKRLVDRCRAVFGCLDMEYDVDEILLDYVIYRYFLSSCSIAMPLCRDYEIYNLQIRNTRKCRRRLEIENKSDKRFLWP